MQPKTIITLCASLAFSVALVKNADAANWKDVLKEVNSNVNGQSNHAGQALPQGQQAVNATQAMQTNSLTELLVQRTGVTGAQAQGGAGALFQIAKNKMQPDAFNQLEQSVPGMREMLGAAPVLSQPRGLAGGLSSIAGASGAGGTAGNLISVVSAFQQQGMSPAMVQQFIPVVIDYVKAHGNDVLVNTLSAALIGH
jgi:hypothetical protein